jgi:ribosomal protein S18 acetylase RimI-like enzyme
VGPTEDEDNNPRVTGSLVTLVVDPDHRGAGHGSRLLSAAVDTMRANLFAVATTWVTELDTALRDLLTSAGWAPDGVQRAIDTGAGVITESRFHTRVG